MLNVKPLLTHINPDTFLEDYLKACGIENILDYLNPTVKCYDNPVRYPNIDKAAECLNKHLSTENDKIGILVDSDNDGICSAAIMANFLIKLGLEYKKDIIPFLHTAKQHGLHPSPSENIVNQVIENNINLLIIPDAGTNDAAECEYLTSKGIEIIILDHHEVAIKNNFAIIVNHHLGKDLNVDLPGAGVTLKFIEYYCDKFNLPEPYYYDLVASAIVSDVCNLRSFENRAFLDIGLNIETVENPMLKLMFEKSCKKGVNPEGLAWGANPLVNSLCRSDAFEDKIIFFDAMATGENIKEGLKVANRAHRVQTNSVKKIMEQVMPTLDTNHKVIVGFTEKENKNYIGLVANIIMSTYGKPVILLREKESKDKEPTEWTGSIRSAVPLLTKINNTGLAFCMGHEFACGITVKKSNLNKLINWLETLNLSETPDVPVTAILTPKQVNVELSDIIDEWKILWGEGVPKPTFSMDIDVDKNYVNVYRKNTNTIKAFYKGIDILMFFANEDDIKAFENGGKCRIVFDINKNEWNGKVKPQCIVNKYEFIKKEDNEDDWMEDF